MRLNKYLAASGVASRRESDKLINEGKVTVNGKTASLGADVNEDDQIYVNGARVTIKKNEYYILNKPKGYICSVSDEKGRKTHGQGPQHGAERQAEGRIQSPGGDGDADAVIEKGPEQILFDVPHGSSG